MYPLLFSFRRCPYAIRARLAMAASGIEYKTIEVSLKNKPAQLLDISPKGTVPVLLLPTQQVIEQSLEIMDWALQQSDPLDWLRTKQHKESDALIHWNDTEFKYHLDRYKYPGRYADTPADHHRAEGLRFLEALDTFALNRQAYLFDGTWSMTDMAIAPFVRQYAATDRVWFDQFAPSGVQAWLDRFLTDDLFSRVMVK